MNDRFLICHPVHGVIIFATSFSEAAASALHYAAREPAEAFDVEIHDRLARRKNPEIYRRHNPAVKVRYMDKGTKMTRSLDRKESIWWEPAVYKI